MIDLSDKSILLTGGTGTIGTALVSTISSLPNIKRPKQLLILSRDEYKQYKLQKKYSIHQYPFIKFVLADITHYSSLVEPFTGVNTIIHAAALKRVEAGEVNPDAFVKTNILGTQNVLLAAQLTGVDQVITMSTDKAVYPTTLYGATKLCAERIMLEQGTAGSIKRSVVRLGNIFGSRGSIGDELLNNEAQSNVELTDSSMTRFTMTARASAEYVLNLLKTAKGDEVFIPKTKAYRLVDLVSALSPNTEVTYSAPRYTEKIHEVLFSPEEARFGIQRERDYILCRNEVIRNLYLQDSTVSPSVHVAYSSENSEYLTVAELRKLSKTEI